MRFKSIEAEVESAALKKKFYADGIKQKTQYRIAAAARCIPESLQGNPLFKGLVKEIYNIGNPVMNHNCFLAGAKIIIAGHSYPK